MLRTLTWDQGTEMSGHQHFTVSTGIPVFFCYPRSPWQRPTNENTNGPLRQYSPKGRDLAGITRTELHRVEHALNTDPDVLSTGRRRHSDSPRSVPTP